MFLFKTENSGCGNDSVYKVLTKPMWGPDLHSLVPMPMLVRNSGLAGTPVFRKKKQVASGSSLPIDQPNHQGLDSSERLCLNTQGEDQPRKTHQPLTFIWICTSTYTCDTCIHTSTHIHMTKQTEMAVLDMVTHAFNPSTWVESEAGIYLWI